MNWLAGVALLSAALAEERRQEESSGGGLVIGLLAGAMVIPLFLPRTRARGTTPIALFKVRVTGSGFTGRARDAHLPADVIARVRQAAEQAIAVSGAPANVQGDNIKNGAVEITIRWPDGALPNFDRVRTSLQSGPIASSIVAIRTGYVDPSAISDYETAWSQIAGWSL